MERSQQKKKTGKVGRNGKKMVTTCYDGNLVTWTSDI